MDRAVFDRMAQIDMTHWWFVARRKIIAKLIERKLPSRRPLRILEIGAGTGSNIKLLQQFGQVDAIEPDEGARSLASTRTGIDISGGHLPHQLNIVPGSYDLIVLLDVLEHIEEDRPALLALKQGLTPGGQILLTVPALPWLFGAHDVAHHHKRRYTRKTLISALIDSGYKVDYISHFNTILSPVIIMIRAIEKLFKRESTGDQLPSPQANKMLEKIFSIEARWIHRLSLPFGISIAVIASPEN
jgi:SAM-dependent methyltransferase